MSTSSIFLAKRELFPDLFISSEGSSVSITATGNQKEHFPSFQERQSQNRFLLRTPPFLGKRAPFYHHGNGDAAAPARTRYLNMPPKLLACIRFLYKVVHENGRLRKFNRARQIEFNFFYRLDYLYETWHTCSSCLWL